MRKWIMEAFERMKEEIKKELHSESLSRIHLSFDGWSAPNTVPYMAVIAHFTDKRFKNRSKLIAFRRLHEGHSGENMGDILI